MKENPGARISLEYASWRNSWSTNCFGVCFLFFKKKLEHGVCVMNQKPSKTQGKLSLHHSPGFPVSTFFWKKARKKKMHNLVWSSNFFSVCGGKPWSTNFFRVCTWKLLEHAFPNSMCIEKTLFWTSTFAEIANACYQCWIPQTDLNHVRFLSPTARDTHWLLTTSILFKLIKSQRWSTNNFLVWDTFWRMALGRLEW